MIRNQKIDTDPDGVPTNPDGLSKRELKRLFRPRFGSCPNSPWEKERKKKPLVRESAFGEIETLDRGVRFFVLALEALGARTLFSCEGHPDGFYAYFRCPYRLATEIAKTGFKVEVEEKGRFKISLDGNADGYFSIRDLGRKKSSAKKWTRKVKELALQAISINWHQDLLLPKKLWPLKDRGIEP